MIPYIVPFLIVIFGAIRYDIYLRQDANKFLLWIGLYIYLTCLIGFRYMVGGDSYFYMIYFNNISTKNIFDISWDSEYQPFFTILNAFAKTVYPSFTSFQILHAIIINSCLFYFISKNSQFRFFTLFLCMLMFYINFSVEILREALAIMVFILNYKNFERNNWVKYYLGVAVALMFHLSAIFLVILPLGKILRLNKWYVLILFITFFMLSQLQSFFTLFDNVDKINSKIHDYSEASYGWKSTFLFFVTKTLIPVGIFLWAKNKYKMEVKYESLICVFGLLGICSVFNTIIFTRFSNYLVLFYCIALSDLLVPFFRQRVMTSSKLFLNATFIIILFTYGYVSFYWPDRYYEKWVPYYSIFSDEAASNRFIDRKY